mgnify:CR=1 FL=1
MTTSASAPTTATAAPTVSAEKNGSESVSVWPPGLLTSYTVPSYRTRSGIASMAAASSVSFVSYDPYFSGSLASRKAARCSCVSAEKFAVSGPGP